MNNSSTHLEYIEDARQLGDAPSNTTTENSVPLDENLSSEDDFIQDIEGHLVDEGTFRQELPSTQLQNKRVSPEEKSIRIILPEEYGQLREHSVVIPEIKHGKLKVTMTMKYKAGHSPTVKISSDIKQDSGNVAATRSDEVVHVEEEIKTGRNEESAARARPFCRCNFPFKKGCKQIHQ